MSLDTTTRILLVEDDREIAGMLADLLVEHGFATTIAGSGAAMDEALRSGTFDMILLDIMLPGEDGLSVCRRLRATSSTPIILVTALGDDVDRIVGLEIGADDYIAKPFNSRELVARVKALLRRAAFGEASQPARTAMSFNGWRIDPLARQLLDPEGSEVSLTSAEFDVLLALCLNPRRILSRRDLLALTHVGVAGPVERSVDVHVSRVRQKIEPNLREPVLIKTVRMGGYIFTPHVEKI
ncbi:MAG: response regulator transcription factor [Rhodobacteraceae bacterium]|nr:response regulator transcription factor [Paracoccaceae bacterium]MBR9820214.1 response regulator transcription factor [Paracoccaceae bacterium]